MNFFRTIYEECHKNEVDQISKQNMIVDTTDNDRLQTLQPFMSKRRTNQLG